MPVTRCTAEGGVGVGTEQLPVARCGSLEIILWVRLSYQHWQGLLNASHKVYSSRGSRSRDRATTSGKVLFTRNNMMGQVK